MALLAYPFSLNGLSVFVREKTPTIVAHTILVLHGWNTTGSENWVPFLEHFPLENTRIIAIDLPGFANSSQPTEVWSATEYADFIAEFISKKVSSSVDIIGHSFGGAIAVILAAKYPHLVKKMVLAAPAIVRLQPSLSSKIITKISKKGSFLKHIPLVKKVWYKFFGSSDYAKTDGIMKQIMTKVIKQDLQHFLPAVSCPVLLIWGTVDKYTPYWQAKKIADQLSDVNLVTLNNVNHGIHLNALPSFIKEVYNFLR